MSCRSDGATPRLPLLFSLDQIAAHEGVKAEAADDMDCYIPGGQNMACKNVCHGFYVLEDSTNRAVK